MTYKVMTITKEHQMEFPISMHQSKQAALKQKRRLVATSKKRGHWNSGDKYWIAKTKSRTRSRPRARKRRRALYGGSMRNLRL